MSDYSCPKCKVEMERDFSLVSTHITGDDKYMHIIRCPDCCESHFYVSMSASLSYADNDFSFRIKLTEDEVEMLGAAMKACPRDEACSCPAHAMLDGFDNDNKERRVIIEDVYHYYKDDE